ncbi:MAG TPA: hypothetical protein VGM88_29230 [Kofleriaceae bacterium]
MTRFALASVLVLGACSSDDSHELGTVQMGGYTMKISREGDAPVAGAMTDFVVKPESGGMPTSVKGWIGTSTRMDSAIVDGVYDPDDGDYDHDITVPSPLATDAMWVFEVDTNGTDATASIAFQGD